METKKLEASVGLFRAEVDDQEIRVIIPIDVLVGVCQHREDYGNPKIINQRLFAEEVAKAFLENEPPNNDRDGRTRLEGLIDNLFEDVYASGSASIEID